MMGLISLCRELFADFSLFPKEKVSKKDEVGQMFFFFFLNLISYFLSMMHLMKQLYICWETWLSSFFFFFNIFKK